MRPSAVRRSGTEEAHSPALTVPISIASGRSQRVVSGCFTALRSASSLRSGGEQRDELLDRADARQPAGGVRGAAGYEDAEAQRAAVARGDVQRGRLRDDAGVGPPAPAQERVGAQAAVLLADHRAEQQRTRERHAQRGTGAGGPQRRDHARLHVARPAAVHGARRDPTAERRLAAPRRRVAGRYHVDVRVEQQATARRRVRGACRRRPTPRAARPRRRGSPARRGSRRAGSATRRRPCRSRPSGPPTGAGRRSPRRSPTRWGSGRARRARRRSPRRGRRGTAVRAQ